MKKSIILLFAASALLAVSCNKDDSKSVDAGKSGDVEMTITNGVATKGYIDGTTFYEKATADLHDAAVVPTARTMYMSAYYRLQDAATGANYFVGSEFVKTGSQVKVGGVDTDVWRHTPAYYWPIDSDLDFLAYSSSDAFAAKDAQWNATNASSSVALTMSRARCQDDVVFAANQMSSSSATSISGSDYVTAQPVAMSFSHSQAWIEFQLSIQQESMKDKVAITEIIIEDAYDNGKLNITRTDANASAAWDFTGIGTADITFDDTYSVYGHSKSTSEYTELNQAITDAEAALEAAKLTGNEDEIAAKEAALQTAKDNLAAAVALYPVVNPLNTVGTVNDPSGNPGSAAATSDDCSYLDMLLPQQAKTAFIIKYVLAGRPEVLEYRYDLSAGHRNWEMGTKYVYDIDFVISEITVSPTVTEWTATFDGDDLAPVELL